MHKEEGNKLRERSGTVKYKDKITSFLYDLMRDHVPTGIVEELVQNATITDEEITYSNGFLASYARDLARRLFTEEDALKEIEFNMKKLTDTYLAGGSGDCVHPNYYTLLNRMRKIVEQHDARMMAAKGFIPK